jgi:hypothetical protein
MSDRPTQQEVHEFFKDFQGRDKIGNTKEKIDSIVDDLVKMSHGRMNCPTRKSQRPRKACL